MLCQRPEHSPAVSASVPHVVRSRQALHCCMDALRWGGWEEEGCHRHENSSCWHRHTAAEGSALLLRLDTDRRPCVRRQDAHEMSTRLLQRWCVAKDHPGTHCCAATRREGREKQRHSTAASHKQMSHVPACSDKRSSVSEGSVTSTGEINRARVILSTATASRTWTGCVARPLAYSRRKTGYRRDM